jgi:hypothetical protein
MISARRCGSKCGKGPFRRGKFESPADADID